ncbi:response regulator transcription factor [Salinibacterium sp.]|uniref:response regulator transcription factor n=1 Tax=Salinibacterium sp. TaxID=1915057 RepID=UPI0037CB941E
MENLFRRTARAVLAHSHRIPVAGAAVYLVLWIVAEAGRSPQDEKNVVFALFAIAIAASGFVPMASLALLATTLSFVAEMGGETSPARRQETIDALSPREREVFILVARGMSNAEIAAAAYVSEATVKTHVAAILRKLDLRSRVQVVVFAHQHDLVVI